MGNGINHGHITYSNVSLLQLVSVSTCIGTMCVSLSRNPSYGAISFWRVAVNRGYVMRNFQYIHGDDEFVIVYCNVRSLFMSYLPSYLFG